MTALNITIDSVSLGAVSTLTFTARDSAGRGAVGLLGGASGQVRLAVAKLLPSPSAGEPTSWQNMIVSYSSTADAGAGLPRYSFTRGSTERGTLVDNRDGTYVYTLATDLTTVRDAADAGIAYQPTLTHRVVLHVSGTINGHPLPFVNVIKELVPAGGAVTVRRDIVETKSCNECHGKLVLHGSRYEAGYCVTCHNTNSVAAEDVRPDGGLYVTRNLDFSHMVHGIHSASARRANGGPDFTMRGGRDNFSEVTYPQDLNHCRKCHETSAAAPQGDNWKSVVNKNTCAGCHASPTFDTHASGFADNSACATCHGPTGTLTLCGPTNNRSCRIEDLHQTVNPTPNNPVIPAGLARISYDIKAVTLNAMNQAEIEFRILRDNASIDVKAASLGDLTGGPSFLLGYAAPQEGITTPADYNNAGNGVAAAQPVTVSLANLRNSTLGTLEVADAGYFVAKTNFVFPTVSNMRAVALQGYFSQTDAGVLGTVARHTVSVVKAAAGDTTRRSIVDPAKCANCHEWFEAHGGNRVYETQVCVLCHNPNLSSSGRAADPATVLARLGATGIATLQARGIDAGAPLTFPEEAQNFRELLHGIHSAGFRTLTGAPPQFFVRDRGTSGVYAYDFSEVTFPNEANNCEACHKPGTYDTDLPPGELAGTRIVPGTTGDRAGILAARATAGFNPEDIVTSPGAAACSSCHAATQAINHMKLNGGYVNGPRSGLLAGNLETCNVCHGAGRMADTTVAHQP